MALSRTQLRVARIVLDLGLLVGFVIEFLTREGPDYDFHSWVGVVLVPIIAVHLATNWSWVRATLRRRAAHPEWKLARFNGVFSIVAGVCIVTGFPIWLEWSDAGAWSTTHTLTGFASLLMMVSHLWRNRGRIRTLLGRRRSLGGDG